MTTAEGWMAKRMDLYTVPEPNTGCLLWLGAHVPGGYGRIRDTRVGRLALAHRVSFELARGPIPDGLQLDHLCRQPACVNPDHLEPVTRSENCSRAVPYRLKPGPRIGSKRKRRLPLFSHGGGI